MLVHFHGIGKALRGRGDNPRDVDHYQVEQQIDAFTTANPGTRIVALLPIGVQTENDEGKHGVSFGNFNTDAFVKAAFGALGGALPSGCDAGRRDHVRAQRRRPAAGRDADLGQGPPAA